MEFRPPVSTRLPSAINDVRNTRDVGRTVGNEIQHGLGNLFRPADTTHGPIGRFSHGPCPGVLFELSSPLCYLYGRCSYPFYVSTFGALTPFTDQLGRYHHLMPTLGTAEWNLLGHRYLPLSQTEPSGADSNTYCQPVANRRSYGFSNS